jgi:hypothetical protein
LFDGVNQSNSGFDSMLAISQEYLHKNRAIIEKFIERNIKNEKSK